MSDTPLKVLLLSAGKMLDKLVPAIAGDDQLDPIDELQLVGFTRSDDASRAAAESQWNLPGFRTPEEGVTSTRPDVVIHLGTSGTRAELLSSIAGADHVRAVVGEKPIGISVPDICKLVDAGKRARKPIFGIFQKRCAPVIAALISAVKSGRFGALEKCRVEANVPWWRAESYYQAPMDWHGTWKHDGGGAGMNQGIHFADLIGYIVSEGLGLAPGKSPFVAVSARTSRRVHTRIEAEDTIDCQLRLAGGILGHFFATTAAQPAGDATLKFIGENGAEVVITEDRLTTWQFPTAEDGDAELIASASGAVSNSANADPMAIGCGPHQMNLRQIVAAILHRKPAIDFSLRSVAHAPIAIATMYKSASKGGEWQAVETPSYL